jgi:hypothetical protein
MKRNIHLLILLYMFVGYSRTLSVARLKNVKFKDDRWMVIRKVFGIRRSSPNVGSITPITVLAAWQKRYNHRLRQSMSRLIFERKVSKILPLNPFGCPYFL